MYSTRKSECFSKSRNFTQKKTLGIPFSWNSNGNEIPQRVDAMKKNKHDPFIILTFIHEQLDDLDWKLNLKNLNFSPVRLTVMQH